ncbi:DgyrCDS3040 [Dimorphilus gyrociliatus]|uniref:DgyrCDS3040 n=1 Tax=Dimorphilus gyrociliatus TaxID=2664684 RepID=A0A7I8VC06_9ANNE|nr:DgyrCDS3040 [Dimorphilus gyrociliatus]
MADDDDKQEIDEMLRNVVQESEKNSKMKRKKKKKKEEEIMLQNLRNSATLAKERDDTIDANTFNPEDDQYTRKTEKSNRTENGIIYEDEVKKKPRRKKKTVETDEGTEKFTTEDSEKPRRRSKPKPKANDEEGPTEETNENTETETEGKKRRKKKRRKKPEDQVDGEEGASNEAIEDQDKEEAEEEQVPPEVAIPDEGYSLCVFVHKTDQLKVDFYIRHPVIRVSILNTETGDCFKKQHKDRAVTYFNETENENIDFVLPMMTEKFDFKQNRSFIPKWEERLVFNENFNWFLNDQCIIFFELLDFVSMASASNRYTPAGREKGWHRIAWGFLKICGANNKLNTNKKVRLQLYKPSNMRSRSKVPDVYLWWKSGQRMVYPSTLYVTVYGMELPREVPASSRSKYAIQKEEGSQALRDLDKYDPSKLKASKSMAVLWSRLPGQICRIPNRLDISLSDTKGGCYTLKFSPNGLSLACACKDGNSYPLYIYELPGGQLRGYFNGHFGLVYSTAWSHNSKLLVSASSDCTVRVWDIEEMKSEPCKVLPHPNFVYTALFHPRVPSIIVTGGFDNIIRVWSIAGSGVNGTLIQELDPHVSHVNCICFDEDGRVMFSSDGLGNIRKWNVYVTEVPSKNGVTRDWTLKDDINMDEIKGKTVNRIRLHPSGRKLLVHTRDNMIRLIDLRLLKVTQRFVGSLNFKEQIGSCFSPCGTFVFGGSENSAAYVWNSDTGDQIASYTDLNYVKPVSDVDYHPHDHIVAFCAFGENHPVLIYKYDSEVARENSGVERLQSLQRKKLSMRAKSPMLHQTAPTDTEDEYDRISTARSRTILLKEEMDTSAKMRWEKINKRVDAVSQFKSGGYRKSLTFDRDSIQSDGLNTLGSTIDAYQSRMMTSPLPSQFPPQPHHRIIQADVHHAADSYGSWKPGFTSVTRRGSVARNPFSPEISMNLTKEGKAEFTVTTVKREDETVIALYDYKAQRSDEISFQKGDSIAVIYKDTDNWWMGEIDGAQGFFPVNYVATPEEFEKFSKNDEEFDDEEYEENQKHVAVGSSSDTFKIVSVPVDSSKKKKRNGGGKEEGSRKPRRSKMYDETESNA